MANSHDEKAAPTRRRVIKAAGALAAAIAAPAVLRTRAALAAYPDRPIKIVVANTVQLSSGVLAPAHPQIKAGNIKGLAVTGEKRWPDLPDIPTMVESGYKDFVFDTYTALMAPAKTPPEYVAFLEKHALAILAKPDTRKKLTEAGFDVTARTGKGHMARVTKEVAMFRQIIVDAKIRI